jgi:galactose oxidase
MLSGDGQNGVTGQPLSDPLVVVVTDESGDPVSDVEVRWAVQGGGSVSDETGQTDANGRSSVQRILGPERGQQTTTATATGLQGSPVTFTATALAAGEPGVTVVIQPPASALSQEVWDPTEQPTVAVNDASGDPQVGTQVTASLASGSGTLEGNATATTDAAGVASFTDLGVRGSGAHSLRFTAGTGSATSSDIAISALPSEATTGAWGPVVNWDIVPLHMNLMPNGKILAWGKTDVPPDTMGMPRLWDPAAGPPSTARMIMGVDTMLFCAGHTLMPDGRLMVSGGHLQDDRGIATTFFFSPDGTPERGPNMAHGRWYPTLTVLSDGRLLTMAGRDQANSVVTTPEIWENNQWVELPGAGPLEIPYYPRNFVDPKNGLIFYASERIDSRWFDVDGSSATGRGRWLPGPPHIYRFNRDYGSAVMYDTGEILVVGGAGNTSWPTPDPKTNQPTATAETIDLNASSPGWRSTGSMAFPRRHMNATILPDGQVLATGGTRGGGFVNINAGLAVKQAELWNPATGQWTTLAANSVMRVYHSVSLLLPDGTVLHGSSGDAMAGTIPVPPERNHEIFSPPYLFKGARPTITSAPGSVGYNQTFSVATPNAAQVTGVRWIRLGTVTHAFDAGQRANTLSFTINGGNVEVTAPAGPMQAPPGHYLLFIHNRNGVPSEGQVIKVQ